MFWCSNQVYKAQRADLPLPLFVPPCLREPPPRTPIGYAPFDHQAFARWEKDSFKCPPYHYSWQRWALERGPEGEGPEGEDPEVGAQTQNKSGAKGGCPNPSQISFLSPLSANFVFSSLSRGSSRGIVAAIQRHGEEATLWHAVEVVIEPSSINC